MWSIEQFDKELRKFQISSDRMRWLRLGVEPKECSVEEAERVNGGFPLTHDDLLTATSSFGNGAIGRQVKEDVRAGRLCERRSEDGGCVNRAEGSLDFDSGREGNVLSCREHMPEIYEKIATGLRAQGRTPAISINGHFRG